MAVSERILFCNNSHVTKIWKTTFPKKIVNEMWLTVGAREYIYIFEIKFEKKNYVSKWRPKQVL